MKSNNAFFKWDDEYSDNISGFPILAPWWSRHYEYPWAIRWAGKGMTVADMGCGYPSRPFKDMLACVVDNVYAVDTKPEIVSLPHADNIEFVIASFAQRIAAIPDGTLDRVFCISVLEDVNAYLCQAMAEFSRVLKPDGLVILTMDVQYDMEKPLKQYPGIDWLEFWGAVADADLQPVGHIRNDKEGIVHSEDFNLCCYHAVLEKV